MVMKYIACMFLTMAVLTWTLPPCGAELYKYQKDGVWYFTDAPPRDMVAQSEKIAGSSSDAPAPSPEGTPLLESYPVRNKIEKAVAATVAVRGSLGYGSGFFISKDGYILTNKHVIRTTNDQVKQEKEYFGAVDGNIEEIESRFAEQKNRLDKYAGNLGNLKRLAENEKDPSRKRSYEDEYDYRQKQYQEARDEYEERRRQYETRKKAYQSQRSSHDYGRAVANLSQSFEIILADNTQLNVRLVAISTNHDLALLKLDGYKTPALSGADTSLLTPGWPVYAVGNPAKLKNSVTSGVFSGFEKGFIKTNAQIYPGNSGGPLITKNGHVAGINTFKQLTHKFEGLGFAIPIEQAFAEFGRFLR